MTGSAPPAGAVRPHRVAGRRIDLVVRPGVRRLVPGAALARLVATALEAGGAPVGATIALTLSDDAELAALNEAHLGKRGPTDVLSFPLLPPDAFPPHEGAERAAGDPARGPRFVLPPRARPHLGDIVVSVERAVVQAVEGRGGHDGDRAWSPAEELRLLVVHGTLHVCGWDHAEPAEAAAMRALERRLLGIAG